MQNKDLESLTLKIAALESQVDHLKSELTFLNERLMDCGFSEGIETLKMSIEEILTDQESYSFLKHIS